MKQPQVNEENEALFTKLCFSSLPLSQGNCGRDQMKGFSKQSYIKKMNIHMSVEQKGSFENLSKNVSEQ